MRRRAKPPTPAAGSMADIGFLLLIFFLVSTTMVKDKGISVVLPEFYDGPVGQAPNNTVLDIKINNANQLLIEGEPSEINQVKTITKTYILNPLKEKDKPSNPRKAIISIQHDALTSYEHYIAVYDQLKLAINEIRNEASLDKYKHAFKDLDSGQQKTIKRHYPFVVSEAEYKLH